MPSDDRWLTLDELAHLSKEHVSDHKDPRWPYVGLEHMAQGSPFLVDTAPSSASVSTNCVFEPGDILFGKLRPRLRKSLQVDFSGYCSTDILVLRAREGFCPRYVAKVFQSDKVFEAAVQTSVGTRMPRTSWEDLKKLSVFVPPLPEQRRIAEILDGADETIRRSECVIAKLREVKQGLLHDLLTRGLDAEGNLRDPDRSAKVSTGSLSEIAEINPPINADGLSDDTPVSFIPMADVSNQGYWEHRQTRRWDEVRSGYTAFQEDDVLFAKITPCTENGKGAHVTGLANGIGYGSTEFHVLRAKGSNIPRFVYHWCQSDLLRERAAALMIGSAGQQRVPPDFFHDFRIKLFRPEEQERIVEVMDSHDARIRAEEAAVDKLRQVKRGLMDDLLTGRVRV